MSCRNFGCIALILLAGGTLGAAQDPTDAAAPVRTQVAALASHIREFAGQRVRLLDGTVVRIVSARLFLLTGSSTATRDTGPAEIAVVVPDGAVILREGASVVVTGVARTLLGASVTGHIPEVGQLDEPERELLRSYPLVIATSIETPGGVELMRPR